MSIGQLKCAWAQKEILVLDEPVLFLNSSLSQYGFIKHSCAQCQNLKGRWIFTNFSPVTSKPLWEPDNHSGKVVWGWFTNVVLLKEQMRKVDDPSHHGLLQKMRDGSTDQDDYMGLL